MSLRQLFEMYHEQVQFLMIYIREAHPVDGWWFGQGLIGKIIRFYASKTSLETYDPKTDAERHSVAKQCEDALQYGIKTLVDTMNDTTSKAYAAKPTRLYLVAPDGRVEYAADPGPYGFKPQQLKEAIDAYLTSSGLNNPS